MLVKQLRALFKPELYHGWGRNKTYFEGWYYKIISKNEDYAFAIIPGIAMDKEGNKQAFIQVLDGKKQTAEYHKFNHEHFKVKPDNFELSIEDNYFSSTRIKLNLNTIQGELQFKDQIPWSSSWYSPGIMGPYSFVPFMECYHGILSMNHSIEGHLNVKDKTIDFTKGKGYMEKDWGHSFPSAYIWMQSNHFKTPNVSLKASVAKIPWLNGSFVGFIAGLWLTGKLIEFTTYNKTQLRKSLVDKNKVVLNMENKKYSLEIQAQRNEATELAAPILGFMDARISESMTSEIQIVLFDKIAQKVIFEDIGRNAGLEVAGKIDEISIL